MGGHFFARKQDKYKQCILRRGAEILSGTDSRDIAFVYQELRNSTTGGVMFGSLPEPERLSYSNDKTRVLIIWC